MERASFAQNKRFKKRGSINLCALILVRQINESYRSQVRIGQMKENEGKLNSTYVVQLPALNLVLDKERVHNMHRRVVPPILCVFLPRLPFRLPSSIN